jgi:Fur family iron response transcriptional regulator
LQEAAEPVYDYKCNNLGLEPGSLGSKIMNQPRTIVFSTPTEAPAGPIAIDVPRHNDLTGCPWHDVKSMLRDVGLRPTRQRMALGWILFAAGDRHLTAEMLYEEATKAKVPVSLATVYNTLHQFTEVGLLRQVAVDGSKTYFDTNASEHHHFFVEGENELVDIPGADVIVDKMPVAPEGYEIARIDVVVRLKKADKRR